MTKTKTSTRKRSSPAAGVADPADAAPPPPADAARVPEICWSYVKKDPDAPFENLITDLTVGNNLFNVGSLNKLSHYKRRVVDADAPGGEQANKARKIDPKAEALRMDSPKMFGTSPFKEVGPPTNRKKIWSKQMDLSELFNSEFKGDHLRLFAKLTKTSHKSNGFHPDSEDSDLANIKCVIMIDESKTTEDGVAVYSLKVHGNGTWIFRKAIQSLKATTLEYDESTISYTGIAKDSVAAGIKDELEASLAAYSNVEVSIS